METNKIIHGSCLEKTKDINANSNDLVYFDPHVAQTFSIPRKERGSLYQNGYLSTKNIWV